MTPVETEQYLRARVVTLEHGHTNMQQRMTDMEKWRQESSVQNSKSR